MSECYHVHVKIRRVENDIIIHKSGYFRNPEDVILKEMCSVADFTVAFYLEDNPVFLNGIIVVDTKTDEHIVGMSGDIEIHGPLRVKIDNIALQKYYMLEIDILKKAIKYYERAIDHT